MSQLFRQNPFLRVALFFGIGVYLLNQPVLFVAHLLACLVGLILTQLIKTKLFTSAVLAGVLMLMGSAQQFLIHEDEKRDFLPTQPIHTFKGRQLHSDNSTMFQEFLQHHDSAHAGLMVALLVGDTQYIESNTKQQYKSLGLSHLLAVSGMHIGLIFQSLVQLLQITTRNRFPKLIVIVGLILIWGFTHIGQYSPSLLRACVMFTVIHFGKMLNEKSGALNALGISFVILLITQPSQQYHWGFILSHLAVLGIILHHRKWQYITQQMPIWKRWIVQSLAITLGAQLYTSIFLLPLTLTFPTYFLLSNFILVPFFSILLFTCFGEWLLNICIPSLPFHVINQFLFNGLEYLLQFLVQFPYLQWQLHTAWWLLLIVTLFLAAIYYLALESKWRMLTVFGISGINLIVALGIISIVSSKPEIHLWRNQKQKRRLWNHQSQGFYSGPHKWPSTFLIQKGVEFQQSP